MFSWCIFLFSVLVFAWLARAVPSTRGERVAFVAIGAVLLLMALFALLDLGRVVVTRG